MKDTKFMYYLQIFQNQVIILQDFTVYRGFNLLYGILTFSHLNNKYKTYENLKLHNTYS